MCGIAGFFADPVKSEHECAGIVRSMASRLAHRGPDDEGIWVDAPAGVALAHRRLAILDLSPAGHQPMRSVCGRYVMVFNGEIYNHLDIRRELSSLCLQEHPGDLDEQFAGRASGGRGVVLSPAVAPDGHEMHWRGHSDTETLLAAIGVWGVEEALRRAVGMFAFALWDRKEQALYLARDRMGEKPLYYGLLAGALVFASELKAFHAHPAFSGEIEPQALWHLLRHNVIGTPRSIHRGIFKLLPGSVLRLTRGQIAARTLPIPKLFWSLRRVAEEGQRRPFAGSDEEARDELERLLRQSIAGQMVADVPLGAFLSGGIDSSSVVALMQAQSDRPVKTFTIGFHEPGYNEAEQAHAVAAHLGTEHTELYVTPDQAMAVIPRLHELYDEPFADSSQIPTFLVSEMARRHVTVSLSGDGGDELLGGYNRYVWASSVWRRVGWLPQGLRAALAGALTTVPPSAWNGIFRRLGRFLPNGWRQANPGDKLHKLADVLAVESAEEIYDCLISHWKRPAEVMQNRIVLQAYPDDRAGPPELPELEHRMMYLDAVGYLPDDILVKVDRAAMAVSLESRVPFLDHQLVEFAWRLPLSMKIRQGQGKWILRQVLGRYVPHSLMERPKMGFALPLDAWLRGPLRAWVESLLDPARLGREGYFHPRPLQAMWQEHLSGRRNWSCHLWDILMFQAWLSDRR